MIKIIFKSKPYNFAHAGSQAYDIDTTVEMNEDCGIEDVFEAIIKVLRFAGYYPTKQKCLNIIEDIFGDREDY